MTGFGSGWLRRQPWDVIGVVALGGSVGASARYGIGLAWPAPPGSFPWATFVINITGCALIGVFLVLITDFWPVHRLMRPFAATGILGGYTTFSTYAVDTERLISHGAATIALVYLVATPVAALISVWIAAVATRWFARTAVTTAREVRR